MEDVLALYHEPYDETRPSPVSTSPAMTLHGHVREDTRYERNSTRYVHMLAEPLAGWRPVAVTSHRRKREFVELLCRLADEHYPDAARIRVVIDNLNTQIRLPSTRFSPPAKARGYLEWFEFHFTPKHGS